MRMITGFIVFLIILGMIVTASQGSLAQKGVQTGDIGKTFVLDSPRTETHVSVTLNSVKRQSFYINKDGSKTEAPKGREFVIVNVTVKNIGHIKASVFPSGFALSDNYGNIFDPLSAYGMYVYDPYNIRGLYYNEQWGGKIIFKIPKGSGRLTLNYFIMKWEIPKHLAD
ncbi:MAG: Telomeric repeat-binding factor 2 [Candidatus Methanolliviera sp. GoM_asphalt]|nr:MAG: Telomeric repeat-binding factor 2 [Candidatus Methanolliviera sp. GoM_asphalt]